MKKTVLATCIMFFAVMTCCAEDISVTPKAGYIFLSKNLNLKDNYILGASAEYRLTDRWHVEFDFLTSGTLDTSLQEKGYMGAIGADTYLPYNGSIKLTSYNLNTLYSFAAIGMLESFLKLGAGYTILKGDIERQERTFDYGADGVYHYPYKKYDDYKSVNLNAGIALRYKICEMFGIHTEIYDIVMFKDAAFGKLDTPYHSIVVNCGILLSF